MLSPEHRQIIAREVLIIAAIVPLSLLCLGMAPFAPPTLWLYTVATLYLARWALWALLNAEAQRRKEALLYACGSLGVALTISTVIYLTMNALGMRVIGSGVWRTHHLWRVLLPPLLRLCIGVPLLWWSWRVLRRQRISESSQGV